MKRGTDGYEETQMIKGMNGIWYSCREITITISMETKERRRNERVISTSSREDLKITSLDLRNEGVVLPTTR